jgi:acyl-coenzyme A thioesterase PaaI-like protein
LASTATFATLAPLTEVLVVVHNRGRARVRRTISFLIISSVSFLVGGYFALSYAPPMLAPWVMGAMPTDEETLSLYDPPDDFSREVDEHIKSCALAQQLRSNPAFAESRPHLKIPEAIRAHNLTGGTLSGPGMIVVPPYIWNEEDGKSMVSIFYLGSDVTGHPGIVHGGLLATMLDECLARCCFPALPNKVAVTANLQISYKKPTRAGQFLVLKAKTTKVDGRKAWVEGWIEPLHPDALEQPERLVEATGLFIEPRYAAVSPHRGHLSRLSVECC